MRVDQIKKRIKELEALLNHPHQAVSVKSDIKLEIANLETQLKNIKRSMFGDKFKG